MDRYNITGKYLFPGMNPKTHISKRSIADNLQKIKDRLDIDRSISAHKWRHTFATRYLAKGGTLFALQHILGHGDVSTTQKYEHLSKKK